MPFDGRDNTPALNRARLIEALRAEMPADYEWDFSTIHEKRKCGTAGCAIGLAIQIGLPVKLRPPPSPDIITSEDLAAVFGISKAAARNIFLSTHAYGFSTVCIYDVTPTMVADALERLT